MNYATNIFWNHKLWLLINIYRKDFLWEEDYDHTIQFQNTLQVEKNIWHKIEQLATSVKIFHLWLPIVKEEFSKNDCYKIFCRDSSQIFPRFPLTNLHKCPLFHSYPCMPQILFSNLRTFLNVLLINFVSIQFRRKGEKKSLKVWH